MTYYVMMSKWIGREQKLQTVRKNFVGTTDSVHSVVLAATAARNG